MRSGVRRAARAWIAGALVLAAVLGLVLLWRGLYRPDPPGAPLPAAPFDRRGVVEAATPATAEAPPSYGPDRLGIPSLGVDAPVVPEPVTEGGELVVPGNPRTIGRWGAGPDLASVSGTIVLAGHVNVAEVGLGALAELHRLAPGALVVTTDARGRPTSWRVDALLVRAKDDLPAFPTDGPRRLAIVTCGGPLLRTPAGNTYRDNVIAFATPAP